MDDILGRLFIIFVGIAILFYVPVTIMAKKQDTTAQSYIDNAVTEFVDNARTTSRITEDAYENMVEKIYIAHSPCKVSIYHGASYVTPDPAHTGDVTYHQEYFSEADILSVITDDTNPRDYELKDGDYIKVIVYNETPTLGDRLLGMIALSAETNKSLFTSYGGYVGNNIEGLYENN